MSKKEEINKEIIQNWLLERVSNKLNCDKSEVDINESFVSFGLHSTEVLMLSGALEEWIDIKLPPTAMWYHPTIAKLADFIEEEHQHSLAAG